MTDAKPRILWDRRTPMRDGVTLSTDVYLPQGEGAFPTILFRTPYDNSGVNPDEQWPIRHALRLVAAGYAVALQDCRGRHDSDGVWTPWLHEAEDGFDSILWLHEQPWCDGRIGMFGASYDGYTQWAAARDRPPGLRALVATVAAGLFHEGLIYHNGVPIIAEIHFLNFISGRTNQSCDAVDWARMLAHRPTRDWPAIIGRDGAVWQQWLDWDRHEGPPAALLPAAAFDGLDLPVLHISGWFDFEVWSALRLYHRMMERSAAADRQWLILGPWGHDGGINPRSDWGGATFAEAARLDLMEEHVRFFDRFVAERPAAAYDRAGARWFLMGAGEGGEWRESPGWRAADLGTQHWALWPAEGGGLAATPPEGGQASFTYDPADPTPSDPDIATWPLKEQPLTRDWLLARQDVLVFRSEPLADDVDLVGQGQLALGVSTDVPDTDLHATLILETGAGTEALATGRQRLSYRDGIAAPRRAMPPGEYERVRFDLSPTARRLPQGARLALVVAGASWPHYAAHPNRMAAPGDDAEGVPARITLHFGTTCLTLPILPNTVLSNPVLFAKEAP